MQELRSIFDLASGVPMSQLLLFSATREIKGWKVSIHNRHGSSEHSKRHVHITRKGLAGTYSWNVDGTRHDAHAFPINEQCIKKAKRFASEALKIPETSLQFLVQVEGRSEVSIARTGEAGNLGRSEFRSYVRLNEPLLLLGCDLGLVIVWLW